MCIVKTEEKEVSYSYKNALQVQASGYSNSQAPVSGLGGSFCPLPAYLSSLIPYRRHLPVTLSTVLLILMGHKSVLCCGSESETRPSK
jgi:hypothetical protein